MVEQTFTPFILIKEQVISEIEEKLSDTVKRWCADWILVSADVKVERSSGSVFFQNLHEFNCHRHFERQQEKLWILWRENFLDELQDEVFPSDGSTVNEASTMSISVVKDALDNLCEGLVRNILGVASNSDNLKTDSLALLGKKGAGSVCARITFGNASFGCLLNAESVNGFMLRLNAAAKFDAQKLPKLKSQNIPKIASKSKVKLAVNVGNAEISLRSAMSLELGDVIQLDSTFETPLKISHWDGTNLFGAYLGKQGNQIALEVVKIAK
jgi:hypothetical protein